MLPTCSFSIVVFTTVLAACQLPLNHAACPCTEGWVCCAISNVCVDSTDRCPVPSGDGGTGSDGGPDRDPGADDGPVDVQRLQPQHAAVSDGLGRAVALRGDLAAIGAPLWNGAGSHQGAVVVFERRGGGAGVWVRLAELVAPDPVDNTEFGAAVAFLAPDALLVGAPGAGGAGRVYLFRRTGATWSWQQTLAPDLTGVPGDDVATLGFGATLVADDNRAILGTSFATQLFELTSSGASEIARLVAPGGGAVRNALLRGSQVVATASNTIYELDEATGWAAPVAIASPANAVPLAFDGQRLAIWARPGSVQILERTGSGWGAPLELSIPVDPNAILAPQMAWHGDALIVSAQQTDRLLGLWRARLVAGAWQIDATHPIDEPIADECRMVLDGDRAMVGLPHGIGFAALFHLDDAGFTAEPTLGFDDPPATGDGWLAAAGDQILASSPFYYRVLWFTREAGGYRRGPSLVLDDNTQLMTLAVAGGHALVEEERDEVGAVRDIQTYELHDGDWTRGPSLTLPQLPARSWTQSIAMEGDTAVVAAVRGDTVDTLNGLVQVHTWSGGAWSPAALLETGLPCDPHVALASARIAAACNSLVRVFERVGATWYETPAPQVPDPGNGIQQLMLADDLVATSSSATGSSTIDVFRWADGQWRSELHVRFDRTHNTCLNATCVYGLAALGSDRVVLYRDGTSVARYRFVDGAWLAEPPLVLPSEAQRSPAAQVAAAALSGGDVVLSVTGDGDGINTLADAIYVFPWR